MAICRRKTKTEVHPACFFSLVWFGLVWFGLVFLLLLLFFSSLANGQNGNWILLSVFFIVRVPIGNRILTHNPFQCVGKKKNELGLRNALLIHIVITFVETMRVDDNEVFVI